MEKTAVEWLVAHLTEYGFDLKLHKAEINQAKEREVKQSQDYARFCINCDREKYPIVDFESYLKL